MHKPTLDPISIPESQNVETVDQSNSSKEPAIVHPKVVSQSGRRTSVAMSLPPLSVKPSSIQNPSKSQQSSIFQIIWDMQARSKSDEEESKKNSLNQQSTQPQQKQQTFQQMEQQLHRQHQLQLKQLQEMQQQQIQQLQTQQKQQLQQLQQQQKQQIHQFQQQHQKMLEQISQEKSFEQETQQSQIKKDMPKQNASNSITGFFVGTKLSGRKVSNPVVDDEVPTVVKLTNSRTCDSNVTFEPLPPLSLPDAPDFEEIFQKKLKVCSWILDFSESSKQQKEKEIKVRAMSDLIELFENTREVEKLTDQQKHDVFRMLYINIFDQNPPFQIKQLPPDLTISTVDPSWPHLFYCFQILNRYIQIFYDSPDININIAKRAIYLLQLPDANERLQLTSFLRCYYEKCPADRLEVLRIIKKSLIDFLDKQALPYCVMPLLVLTTHILLRSQQTFYNEFVVMIKEVILPLFGNYYFPLFHVNLKQLIITFLSINNNYTYDILRAIELKWPQICNIMQTQIFELLLLIFEKMPQELFRNISLRVFAFIGECVQSLNIKLAEAAIDIWHTAKPDNWIGLNSKDAIRKMYNPISTIIGKHWNKSLVEKATQSIGEMSRIDKVSFQKVKAYWRRYNAQKYKPRIPNDCQRSWNIITKAANEKCNDFDFHSKIKEIYRNFHNEKKPTLEISRFMPVKSKEQQDNQNQNKK